jgi:hypothetical protein
MLMMISLDLPSLGTVRASRPIQDRLWEDVQEDLGRNVHRWVSRDFVGHHGRKAPLQLVLSLRCDGGASLTCDSALDSRSLKVRLAGIRQIRNENTFAWKRVIGI